MTRYCAGCFVMSIWHRPESFEKRKPQLRKFPYQITLWSSLWCIFVIDDWHKRAQHTIDSASSGTVVVGALRKQDEEAMKSKSIAALLHGFFIGSCLQGPVLYVTPASGLDNNTLWHVSWSKPFPHYGAFGWYFITAVKSFLRLLCYISWLSTRSI